MTSHAGADGCQFDCECSVATEQYCLLETLESSAAQKSVQVQEVYLIMCPP